MFSIKHPVKYVRPKNRGQKVKKSRKLKTLVSAIVKAWEDFCTTSSFVGFRYIYYKNRTIFDIFFWVFLMVVLMYWSVIFVVDFLDRYHSLSTTTIIKTQHLPTSRSQFPAITACLSGRVSKSKVFEFIDKYILNNTDLQRTVNLTHFVRIFDLKSNADQITLDNADRVFAEYNLTMRDMLNITTEGCEEIFTVCRWAGKVTPCTQIFKKTMAVGGFCCSFNYPLSNEMILKRKWLRTRSYGLKGGLSFAFKTVPSEDYYYKIAYGNTLRVVIHAPYSCPSFNEKDIIIPKSMETSIEIQSVYNSADLRIRKLPIEDRDCIFGTEKSLKHFARYSNNNCLLECRIERIFKNCGCIAYYFPSDEKYVCPVEKFPCCHKNQQVGVKQGDKKVYSQFSDCDCPDDCVIMKQYSKIHSWSFSTHIKSVDEFYENVTNDNGIVHISYMKSTTMRLNRILSFDEIQLASNIGGIIALFLGCSFISLVEVFYLFTIRMLKFYHMKI